MIDDLTKIAYIIWYILVLLLLFGIKGSIDNYISFKMLKFVFEKTIPAKSKWMIDNYDKDTNHSETLMLEGDYRIYDATLLCETFNQYNIIIGSFRYDRVFGSIPVKKTDNHLEINWKIYRTKA